MLSSLQVMYLKQAAKKYAPLLIVAFLGIVIASNYWFYETKGVIMVAVLFALIIATLSHFWHEDTVAKDRLQSELHLERTRSYGLERDLESARTDLGRMSDRLTQERSEYVTLTQKLQANQLHGNSLRTRMVDLRGQRLLLLSLLVRAFPAGVRKESYIQEWEADRDIGISDTQSVKVDFTNYSYTEEQPALINYLYINLPNGKQMRIALTEDEVGKLPASVGAYEGVRETLLETISFDHFARLIETHPEVQLSLEIKAFERESAA